jgi:hypothetical protein
MSAIDFEQYEEFKDHADFIDKINQLKNEPDSRLKKLIVKWFRLQIRIYNSVIRERLNYKQTWRIRNQESIDIPAYFRCSDLRENLKQLKESRLLLKELKTTVKRRKTTIIAVYTLLA